MLHNIFGKPMGAICAEMDGKQSSYHVGDVKYHLGEDAVYAFDRSTRRRVDDKVRLGLVGIPPAP